MNCPHCQSANIHGPVYSRGSAHRRAAVMFCRSCRAGFDAYEWYGAAAQR